MKILYMVGIFLSFFSYGKRGSFLSYSSFALEHKSYSALEMMYYRKPHFSTANNLALKYLELNFYREAEVLLRKYASHGQIYKNLVVFYLTKGQFSSLKQIYREERVRKLDDKLENLTRAIYYYQNNDFNQAWRYYRKVNVSYFVQIPIIRDVYLQILKKNKEYSLLKKIVTKYKITLPKNL